MTSEPAQARLSDLSACIESLDRLGLLVRIQDELNPVHQAAAAAASLEGLGAVLCERVKGHSYPVLFGLHGHRAAIAALFGCPPGQTAQWIAARAGEWLRSPIPPVVLDHGPANQVIEPEVNLHALPIPTHTLEDGGPYIDSAVFVARDPDTGVRNASIIRAMVAGPDLLTLQLNPGGHLRDYYERASARGRPLELTINNGVGPAVIFASIVPQSVAPIDADELGIASHFIGEPLPLLRSQVVAVEGIAEAQFILEAELLPGERASEGPFPEFNGLYASRADRWVARVKKITRRRNPIWQSFLPGREVINTSALVREAIVLESVRQSIPEVCQVHFTVGGCGAFHAVVQLKTAPPGVAKNAILAAFSAYTGLKMVIAVNEDVDPQQPEQVEWALAVRFRPETGLIQIPAARGHFMNPSTDQGIGTKIGIDATLTPAELDRQRRLAWMHLQPDLSIP